MLDFRKERASTFARAPGAHGTTDLIPTADVAHSTRAIQPLHPGGDLEHDLRVWNLCGPYSSVHATHGTRVFLRCRRFRARQHQRGVSRIQVVCVQDEGELLARVVTVSCGVRGNNAHRHLGTSGIRVRFPPVCRTTSIRAVRCGRNSRWIKRDCELPWASEVLIPAGLG